MTDLAQALAALEATAQADLASASDAATLEAVRVRWFGRKGSLATILRGLGEMDAAERPAAGKLANEVKRRLEVALEERQAALAAQAQAAALTAARLDVTLPGQPFLAGHEHLISQTIREVQDIFIGLGYKVAEGPEVELDYYNFTALNHPPDHLDGGEAVRYLHAHGQSENFQPLAGHNLPARHQAHPTHSADTNRHANRG